MQAFHCCTWFNPKVEICGKLILVFSPSTFIFYPYQSAFHCYLVTEEGSSQHCHNFSCQFGASHFTWHVAGLELRKDFAWHTGEEFLKTVSPNAAKFLNFVQNFTFFDKQ